jgi:integrase
MRTQDPKVERHGDSWRIRVWVAKINEAGQAIRVRESFRLGGTADTKKDEAIQRKRELLATLGSGPVMIQAKLRFDALVERYREVALPALAESTQRKYRAHLAKHVLPGFGKLRLPEIDRVLVERWLVSKSDLAQATRLDLRNLVAAIFSWAAERNLWNGTNPAHGASVGRGGAKREKRYIEASGIRRWLEEITDTAIMDAHRARLVARVALVGGLRVSEVLGLRHEDIQGDAVVIGRAWVRGAVSECKSESSRRRVHVGALAGELLAIDGEWIFGRDGGNPPDDRDLQQHVWRPAAERAGIYHEGFGLHTLRRLCLTWMQEMGAAPLEAMLRAGHRNIRTTALYTMPNRSRDQQMAAGLLERLGPVGTTEEGRKAG